MGFFKTYFYLFIFGCAGSSLLCGLLFPSGRGEWGLLCSCCPGFSLPWLLWLQSTDSRVCGLLQLRPWTRWLWPELSSTSQEVWLTGVTIHHRPLEETLPEEFKQMGAEI